MFALTAGLNSPPSVLGEMVVQVDESSEEAVPFLFEALTVK